MERVVVLGLPLPLPCRARSPSEADSMYMYRIVFQMGQARWADTGTARESTAQGQHGPATSVPVPGTARPRAVPGLHIRPMGQHEARHENGLGPLQARSFASSRRIQSLDHFHPLDSELGTRCI
jgi:hypothetical protein